MKSITILSATVTLLSICALSSCQSSDTTYQDIKGTYASSNIYNSDEVGFQINDVWTLDLSLKEDKTYSYRITVTDTIYGGLVYGKFDVTAAGTYEAIKKDEGIYTVNLSEATFEKSKCDVVIDAVSNRDLKEVSYTLENAKSASLAMQGQSIDCSMPAFYAAKTFDLDTTKPVEDCENFIDPEVTKVTKNKVMMAIEKLRADNKITTSYGK